MAGANNHHRELVAFSSLPRFLLFAADMFRQLFAPGFAIPLLVGFRLDLALYQELRELSALRLAFERHNQSHPLTSRHN